MHALVSLDLDEVAKSGGDAANRQTAVMYMLARYVLARHYFLTEDNIAICRKQYRDYHEKRVDGIPRRSKTNCDLMNSIVPRKLQAVRDQVIQDMREGRKWKVQIALISQSLDDFDPSDGGICDVHFYYGCRS